MSSDQLGLSSQEAEAAALTRSCQETVDKISLLLDELQQFKASVDQKPVIGNKRLPWNHAITGLGAFERLVLSEKRNTDAIMALCKKATAAATGNNNDELDLEKLTSQIRIKLDACNYIFHQTVWDTAKKCPEVAGIRCDFTSNGLQRKSDVATVDVVANSGADWVKILTSTEKRMCYQMTDAGWDWEMESDDELEEGEPLLPSDGEKDVEVARLARQLVSAANIWFHNYRRPNVKILMTRIKAGENHHIDRLLDHVRTFGGKDVNLTIETADQSELLRREAPTLQEALPLMVNNDPLRDFTQTLNVDCSVFMALASDFSHMPIRPDSQLLRSSQHKIDANDEMENGPRIVNTMYPAMKSRDLVCTQDAADTFLKIAYDIGTDTEQARADLLFQGRDAAPIAADDTEAIEADRKRRVAEFAKLSVYPVPDDLRLPIKTVGTITWDIARDLVAKGELPQVALVVGKHGSGLNAMNVSSFLYGWKTQLTTITSNWEAAKRLKFVIETHRTSGDEIGPQIWRIPFARKLLARPKPTGSENGPPLKTRKERKREKESSLQQWVGEDGGEGKQQQQQQQTSTEKSVDAASLSLNQQP